MRSQEDKDRELLQLREQVWELRTERDRLKGELDMLRRAQNQPTDEELARAGLELVAEFERQFGPIPEEIQAEVARKMAE